MSVSLAAAALSVSAVVVYIMCVLFPFSFLFFFGLLLAAVLGFGNIFNTPHTVLLLFYIVIIVIRIWYIRSVIGYYFPIFVIEIYFTTPQ